MSVTYDLKVNRDLLNYKFDGYKLTLDPLAIHRLSLGNAVESPKLPDDFFSFQHLKIFGVVNKLFLDPWHEDSLYFIDSASGVHCAFLDSKMNCSMLKEKKVVENFGGSQDLSRTASTLSFPDERHAVVSDGASSLCIYETGSRGGASASWKVCYKGQPLGPDTMFLIQHSSISNSSTHPSIEVILTHVCKNEAPSKGSTSHYTTKLTWFTFEADVDGNYSTSRSRLLESTGAPEYAVVDGGRVFVLCEKAVSFVQDSANALQFEEACMQEEASVEEAVQEGEACYNWTQKGREVNLYMRLEANQKSSDVICEVTTNHLRLSTKAGFSLDGDLWASVKTESCTWTLTDHNLLEVYLEKVVEEEEWGEVVRGDGRGRRLMPEEQIAALNDLLQPLEARQQATEQVPFNLQQLEECDQLQCESAALYCFHGDTHQLLQKINISTHQWLFSTGTRHCSTPSICLRHDVDALIFQLTNRLQAGQGDWKDADEDNGHDSDPTKADDFSWQHTGTLHAFGYLQASKQQKKFTACSPDFSFVAIAEDRRHVFIYRQPVAIATSLRNRKTSENVAKVAKQHLVSLEGSQVVEGLVCTKDRLFILTPQSLHCVQVVQS